MGTASTNAIQARAVQECLNRYAILSSGVPPEKLAVPVQLWLAAAQFCAAQIYWIEALGLLDSYTCTAASCSKNIIDDRQLEGSVTISGLNGGQPVNFRTPRFSLVPSSIPDPSVKASWTVPATAMIVDHTNALHSISCTIEGDDADHLMISADDNSPATAPGSDWDDDDQVPV